MDTVSNSGTAVVVYSVFVTVEGKDLCVSLLHKKTKQNLIHTSRDLFPQPVLQTEAVFRKTHPVSPCDHRMFSVVGSPRFLPSLRYFSNEAVVFHPTLSLETVIYEVLFTGCPAKTQQRDVIFTMSHFLTTAMTTRWRF